MKTDKKTKHLHNER